jgi:Transposase DDE domain group 1
MLPPGRASDATRPAPTGSPASAMTIGTTAVACFVASAAGVPNVTMTSTLRPTNSVAISLYRSEWPPAQRNAIATLRPSVQPSSRSRSTMADKRPVGRPPNEVRRYYANFSYQAGSWTKPRRVIAKVEWHPGELYPRVGFIVTNMSRPAERVVVFYNKRGTCEQWIKEGKGAINWTRLSCRTFAANAVRLQLHTLAYNLGNFLRTLATPEQIKDWSLTSLKEKLIKIGAKVVSHGRYVAFQMAEVAIPRQMFQEILRLIAELRPQPPPAPT